MAGGWSCKDKKHKGDWVVIQRNCRHSAFDGYRRMWSAWSEVHCPTCGAVWRTKSSYVNQLPDGNLRGVKA